MPTRAVLAAIAAAAGLFSAPALAHDQPAPMAWPGHWGGPFGYWYGGWQPQVVVNGPNGADTAPRPEWQSAAPTDRDGWLRECRRRLGDGADNRPHPADRCEAMLAAPAMYAVPVMLVPVTLVPVTPGPADAQRGKTTVVTEEYIEAEPRRARRVIRQAAPHKRVRIVPDKRVPQ